MLRRMEERPPQGSEPPPNTWKPPEPPEPESPTQPVPMPWEQPSTAAIDRMADLVPFTVGAIAGVVLLLHLAGNGQERAELRRDRRGMVAAGDRVHEGIVAAAVMGRSGPVAQVAERAVVPRRYESGDRFPFGTCERVRPSQQRLGQRPQMHGGFRTEGHRAGNSREIGR